MFCMKHFSLVLLLLQLLILKRIQTESVWCICHQSLWLLLATALSNKNFSFMLTLYCAFYIATNSALCSPISDCCYSLRLSLWHHTSLTITNPSCYYVLWAPIARKLSMRKTSQWNLPKFLHSWDYYFKSPHLSPRAMAACAPSTHLVWNFPILEVFAWVDISNWSLLYSSNCGCSTNSNSPLLYYLQLWYHVHFYL